MTTCPVCCDAYTKTTRPPVSCFSCSYEACSRCVRSFLLSTPAEPHCMNCRHVWNREFLDAHLTRAWREGELKRHRAALLFDRERSMLPATQPAVETELQKRAVAKEVEEIAIKVAHLKKELKEAEAALDRRRFFLQNGRWPEETEAKPVRREFVAACPSETCRGFLSTAYKCGTCQRQFCSACRELQAEDHVCDPSLVATIKAIVSDSRPCPSCGTAISKVSGCDQMYCTQCDTAFSYSTGARIKGVIHNPHYFERLHKLGLAAGNQEVPCQQGLPTYLELRRVCPDTTVMFRRLYQATLHVQETVMPAYPNPAIPADNTDLRVKYLLKEIDEHKFQQLLQQRDRRRQRELEVRECIGLFLALCTDFFVACNRRTYKGASSISDALNALLKNIEDHVNAPLRAIGDRYANIVPQIHTDSVKAETNTLFMPQGYRPVKKTAAVYSDEEVKTSAIISHQTESSQLQTPK